MPVATCLYFLHVSTCGGQGWVHIGMCIYAACTHLYVWCHSLYVCLGVCMHVLELREKSLNPYAAKARWWVLIGTLATLLLLMFTWLALAWLLCLDSGGPALNQWQGWDAVSSWRRFEYSTRNPFHAFIHFHAESAVPHSQTVVPRSLPISALTGRWSRKTIMQWLVRSVEKYLVSPSCDRNKRLLCYDLLGGPYGANQHSTLTGQTAEQDIDVLCQQPEKTIRTWWRDAMTSQLRKEQHLGA